jgi:phytoene dehydrogenase-like protein
LPFKFNLHRYSVASVLIEDGAAVGVTLKSGGVVRAPVVLSNASVWDTYSKLLPPGAVSQKEKEDAMVGLYTL